MLLRGKYGQGYATENAGVDTLNIEDLIHDSCGQDDKKIFQYILHFILKNISTKEMLLRANVSC